MQVLLLDVDEAKSVGCGFIVRRFAETAGEVEVGGCDGPFFDGGCGGHFGEGCEETFGEHVKKDEDDVECEMLL